MHVSEYYSNEFGHGSGDDLPCCVWGGMVESSVLMILVNSLVTCTTAWAWSIMGILWQDIVIMKQQPSICLYEHSKTLTIGQRSDGWKLLKVVCGAIACPQYQNDRYLTCACCMYQVIMIKSLQVVVIV